ncbi:uncharacterized protein KY384_005751 [Bacidia gigantensis]|uniref:uncharacterized protein n=1 Tax=Bacidia gigantensis TaxID=2732470 RepID=UPI001D056444|nr:uncharacterized protein KY384_005751 [Bacidia gigantensis]KAG8529116.1 hypothetical protein KY384_005751 [Bacidia gigantensis]
MDQMLSSLDPPTGFSTGQPTAPLEAAPVPIVPAGPRQPTLQTDTICTTLNEPTRERPGIMRRFMARFKRSYGHQADSAPPIPSLPPLEPIDLSMSKPGTAGHSSKHSIDEDRLAARLFFHGDETIAPKSEAAAWLGGEGMMFFCQLAQSRYSSHITIGAARDRVRKAFMESFELHQTSILFALRELCSRLYLKAESQHVNRIVEAFAERYYTSNLPCGYRHPDVVHAIVYSILMLNTDLHANEVGNKMTKNEYLKNTLPTIRSAALNAAPETFKNVSEGFDSPISPRPKLHSRRTSVDERRSFDRERPKQRLSRFISDNSMSSSKPQLSRTWTATTLHSNAASASKSRLNSSQVGDLVLSPSLAVTQRTWEYEVENILKEIYNSVRQEPLPLFSTVDQRNGVDTPPLSAHSLAPSEAFPKRQPSSISLDHSRFLRESSRPQMYTRERSSTSRLGIPRRHSRARSTPRSQRSSIDEQSSITSPSSISAWSNSSHLSKLPDRGSCVTCAKKENQPAIGFANAVSQAIIREEAAPCESDDGSLDGAPLLEDDSLGLAGAPWAKEGILHHKHVKLSENKKAFNRSWEEAFAVIEKGRLLLFDFKTMGAKKASQVPRGTVVGGGNWAENTQPLATFVLRYSYAAVLPSQVISRSRPYIWALTEATGSLHHFQAGTPEIVQEFVTTANYWSARLSQVPYGMPATNLEFGWSRRALYTRPTRPSSKHSRSASISSPRPSTVGSSRYDKVEGRASTEKSDRGIFVCEWEIPRLPAFPSKLMEVDQKNAMARYLKSAREELQKHNELWTPICHAYLPNDPKLKKTQTNWHKKANWLANETWKFTMFIESLDNAEKAKEKVYAEREKT